MAFGVKLLNFSFLCINKLKIKNCTLVRHFTFYCKHNSLRKTPVCLNRPICRCISTEFQKMCSTTSPKANHLVFVYGTLKKGEPNYDVIEKVTEGIAKFIGKAKTVKKWPLVIASRYNIPYLLYSEGRGMHVVGEVYEVDDAMLAKFDEFECHPEYYTRLTEEVQLISENEEKVLKPWIYFLKKFRPELLDLPCLSDYSSEGSHGLKYVTRYCRSGENYYSDVMEV